MKVLIVSENMSMRMGGEASLPFYYFKLMRERGIDVYSICHARVRDEVLGSLGPDEPERHFFVEDTGAQRSLHRLRHILPHRLHKLLTEQPIHLSTQRRVRGWCRGELITRLGIDIIFEPAPITPKGVSLMYRMGVPVVIGPLCGGLEFPPAFRSMESRSARAGLALSRACSRFIHRISPGKLQAESLIVANECTAKALPKGYRGKVYKVVESGVDLGVWEPNPKVNRPPDVPVRFVFAGRFVELKGVRFLVTAFARIAKTIPAQLDLVGSGPMESEIRNQVETEGIGDQVRFHGWQSRPDSAKIVRECDVFVFPSLRECGGTVLLEAMALGLPIICCDWAGPRNYVDETVGIRVDPTSPEEYIQGLANAMLKLARSRSLREKMGAAGPERARSHHFDWDSKTQRVIEILEETLREHPRRISGVGCVEKSGGI